MGRNVSNVPNVRPNGFRPGGFAFRFEDHTRKTPAHHPIRRRGHVPRTRTHFEENSMLRKIALLSALLAALGTAGCNTVEGFGQDMKKGAAHVGEALGKAGDKISETASELGNGGEKSSAKSSEQTSENR